MKSHPFFKKLVLASIVLLSFTASKTAQSQEFDYTLYSLILKDHVVLQGAQSKVHYAKLKLNESTLKKYNSQVSKVSPKQFNSWSQKSQIAFLINAYNSFTLELIVDNYPLKSIKKIGGWFTNPWKIEFFTFLGKKSHLDHIEHGILRVDYKEPRIHFAVNCASIGCPPLSNEVFRSADLDKKLNASAKNFLTDPFFNEYKAEKNELHLSSIFKWYGKDFGSEKELKQYLAPIILGAQSSSEKVKKFLKSDIEYKDYDWGLNDSEN
jgi:hypothetical protein